MKEIIKIPSERIINRIFLIRNKKVMIDRDLAELYGVETKVFNQAVRRNTKRFPSDFMFQLNKKEMDIWRSRFMIPDIDKNEILRSQFVTLKQKHGKHSKYTSLVFTEQGVAMLSSVLNSERAIQVNIQIIRTFTKLRELLITHKKLREKIEKMESKYNKKFKIVFQLITRLISEEEKPKEKIGFSSKK